MGGSVLLSPVIVPSTTVVTRVEGECSKIEVVPWSDFRLFWSENLIRTSPIVPKLSEMDSRQNFSWKTYPGAPPNSSGARKTKKKSWFFDQNRPKSSKMPLYALPEPYSKIIRKISISLATLRVYISTMKKKFKNLVSQSSNYCLDMSRAKYEGLGWSQSLCNLTHRWGRSCTQKSPKNRPNPLILL